MNRTFLKMIAFVVPLLLCSCASRHPMKKELFSWSLNKEQLTTIKNTLMENGYTRLTKEDYRYEGAYVTQYVKEVKTETVIKNNRVNILMSFKSEDLSSGIYRNFGFSVSNFDYDNIDEINAEIYRIENIIYAKLVDAVGADKVVRGPRRNIKSYNKIDSPDPKAVR